ncbi:Uncharacterized protein Rs2_44259 [Raphanus sativus]|nr:Uncharacterized protein Rs2_48754 [Raphanus sativus]KAJ4873973.1 Uncharacterized protein Rs2_44259 [Raphanus sativus]
MYMLLLFVNLCDLDKTKLRQEKEEAERKVDALSSTVESLREELLNERNISRVAKESAERAIEERTVVSRVVQSVGCIMKSLRCHWSCTERFRDRSFEVHGTGGRWSIALREGASFELL